MAHVIDKPGEINERVATQLRGQLAMQRVTLRALGESTGISYSTLSRMLNGERDITLGQLAKITAALNLDIRNLFND